MLYMKVNEMFKYYELELECDFSNTSSNRDDTQLIGMNKMKSLTVIP